MSPVSSPKKMRTEEVAMDLGAALNLEAFKAFKAAAPCEDMRPILEALEVAVAMEAKFEGGSQPPIMTNEAPVITSGMRDGSAHVLRCLKVWYDLPSDIFFNSVSIMDRFFLKMKAQPKHLACIAVASFHLACQQHHKFILEKEQLEAKNNNNKNNSSSSKLFAIPEPADIVSISQARCTQGDLLRMQEIVAKKLHVGAANPGAGAEAPITTLSFLRMLHQAARTAVAALGLPDLVPGSTLPDHLVHQLEILACDSMTLDFRPSEVALALLATEFQVQAARAPPAHTNALHRIVAELQTHLQVTGKRFAEVHSVVVTQLDNYNTEGTVVHRQRLTWKLSNRTLKLLRPTDRLRKILPTIKEDSPAFMRMRADSSSSCESFDSLGSSDEEMFSY